MAVASLASRALIRVPSTDGVAVAVHEFGRVSDAPTLLISHATGFHAHCYLPMASELEGRYRCIGFDHRGHGDTDVDPAWETDWRRFGDDALAVAREVAPQGGLVGFGHSMGASSLLMAAHRAPELFERLVLFEPISHEGSRPTISAEELRGLPIVVGALRRRREFPSFDAAYENFRSKPPMSLMTPAVLRNYVDHGFRESVGADGEPMVELRCDPELEASIFVTGRDNGVWSLLRDIRTPCLVLGGHVEDRQPSAQSEAIAQELPNGEYVLLDHHTHFGPFSHPAEVAELIGRA